jgi:hypothetical protein
MTDTAQYSTSALQPATRGKLKRALLLGAVTFVAGVVAVIWTINHWDGARGLILGTPTQPIPQLQAPAALPQAQPSAAISDPSLSLPRAGESVSALEERMVAIGDDATAASGNAARAEGLMLAFAARRAIERGQSLGYLAPAIRRHFGAAQPAAVAAILTAATKPVTLEGLRSDLDRLEPQLLGGAPTEGLFSRFSRTFSELIVFRSAGTPSTRATDRLDRAKRFLSAGNVDRAKDEIAAMPGASVAADWLARAAQFRQTQSALDTIEASSVSVIEAPLSPAPGAGPSGAKPQ